MKKPEFKVLPKFYELPYMFGFWISDPEYIDLREGATGSKVTLSAWLFMGNRNLFRLTLRQDQDDPDGLIMSYWMFLYEIDGPQLIVQDLRMDEGKLTKDGESYFVPWAYTKDGKFNQQLNEKWWRYIPASIGDLEEAGYGRDFIEEWIEAFRQEGEPVIELFDERTALDLIAEAQKLEDEGL